MKNLASLEDNIFYRIFKDTNLFGKLFYAECQRNVLENQVEYLPNSSNYNCHLWLEIPDHLLEIYPPDCYLPEAVSLYKL